MKIAITIATWNRCDLLGQTLEALRHVRIPPGIQLELLVCDNNSTDATKAVIESFVEPLAKAWGSAADLVRYIFEPQPGLTSAMNRLLKESTGDWIIKTDDDVLVPPDWLERYVQGIERYPKAGILAGPVVPWLVKPVSHWKQQLMRQFPGPYALVYADRDEPLNAREVNAAGANMAMLRQAIPPGGYDPNLGPHGHQLGLGDDIEMIRAILARGYEGWMLGTAQVRHYVHPHRLTRKYLWRWQGVIGWRWIETRGKPTPGKWGVPWWAWKQMAKRWLKMALTWRPWYARAHMQAVVEAAQWRGYMRG